MKKVSLFIAMSFDGYSADSTRLTRQIGERSI